MVNIDDHIRLFEELLASLASASPMFINSQTGKDHFSIHQNMALIQLEKKISQQTGIGIVHETHRGKWSFAAYITREYLLKDPGIRLTLDASHWCNVAETYLEDKQEAI